MEKIWTKLKYERKFFMTKKIVLIALLFALSTGCGITAGILYIRNNEKSTAVAEEIKNEYTEFTPNEDFQIKEETYTEPELPENVPVYESEKYVVTLSDTKIIIYKISSDGSMQTIEEKPISPGSIPREDYGKLYSGIIVDTLESAKELVEDYIS